MSQSTMHYCLFLPAATRLGVNCSTICKQLQLQTACPDCSTRPLFTSW